MQFLAPFVYYASNPSKRGYVRPDLYFNLCQYFNDNGQRVHAIVLANGDMVDYLNELQPDILHKALEKAVTEGKFGYAPNLAQPSSEPTDLASALDALASLVASVATGDLTKEAARSVTSLSVNNRRPIPMADVLRVYEREQSRKAVAMARDVLGLPRRSPRLC